MELTIIPAEVNVEVYAHVQKLLQKVNRKAAKLGTKPFAIVNEQRFTTVVDRVEYSRVRFEVIGQTPVISGWSVIASIDHVEGIVKGEVSPQYVKHANCEHCNQNRLRNFTVILQNKEGIQKQVGKTCLRDFLGHDPSAMLSFWSFLETIEDYCEENSGYSGGIASIELTEALCLAIDLVNRFGYVSRKKADETFQSTTGSDVMGWYFSKKESEIKSRGAAIVLHSEKAKTIIEWVKAKEVDPENSYWYNMKSIAENEYTTHKSIGFAASMIPAYHREMEEQREREVQLNEYFGAIKDKINIEVEYTKTVTYSGFYGMGRIHFFKDSEGRCFKWSTSTSIPFNEGQKLKLVATIKDHEEYKGRKQTSVTRAKLNEV